MTLPTDITVGTALDAKCHCHTLGQLLTHPLTEMHIIIHTATTATIGADLHHQQHTSPAYTSLVLAPTLTPTPTLTTFHFHQTLRWCGYSLTRDVLDVYIDGQAWSSLLLTWWRFIHMSLIFDFQPLFPLLHNKDNLILSDLSDLV